MTLVLTEKEFQTDIVSKYTDVIGEKLGGKIISCSDQFFAAAENLIKPKPPIRDATKFTYSGAWYDGWETRRHNPEEADWVTFNLGVSSAYLIGCEVDTAFFNGNHAPYISIEALQSFDNDNLETVKESDWEEVIPKTECGPSQRHFFSRIALTEKNYTHARLRMYPDGGIARFRLYGLVVPVFSKSIEQVLDLASVQNGGVAVKFSDQHFGTADNLLLPGRGHDMSDGWETKRSRDPGHTDWVIIKLGIRAKLHRIVVDTAHFRGNYPQLINVEATYVDKEQSLSCDLRTWDVIVPDSKTSADKEHYYDIDEEFANNVYSHIKLTIIPDGGVKRVRAFGVIA
ncbi:Allantoicase [Spathaspora sp. JA1]|nr:Allantoicase [Spathaspora sp. JA1]